MPPRQILLPYAALVALAFPAVAAPDEEQLGKAAGYPIGTRATWFYDESVRVGSFSNLDRMLAALHPGQIGIAAAASTTAAAPKIEYRFENQTLRWTIFWRASASPACC